MKPKGRRIAIATVTLGLATMAGAAFAIRTRIAEEYWLWNLSRASDDAEKARAVERLGKLKSTRAVPLMMDWMREGARRGMPSAVIGPIMAAIRQIEAPAVPSIIPVMDDPSLETRTFSILLLTQLGPRARHALPALIERAQDARYKPRSMAIQALGKIGPASTVLPALIAILGENENLAVRAAETLGDMGPEAGPALQRLKDVATSWVRPDSSKIFQAAIDKIEGRKPPHPERVLMIFEVE